MALLNKRHVSGLPSGRMQTAKEAHYSIGSLDRSVRWHTHVLTSSRNDPRFWYPDCPHRPDDIRPHRRYKILLYFERVRYQAATTRAVPPGGMERFRGTAADFPMTLLSKIYIISSGCLWIDPFSPFAALMALGSQRMVKRLHQDSLILPQRNSGRHPIFSVGSSSFFAIHCPFIFCPLPR